MKIIRKILNGIWCFIKEWPTTVDEPPYNPMKKK